VIRPLPLALLALLALATPAGALFEPHLDGFASTVDDRLAALPETGGTKTEAKQRKALLKAKNALLLASGTRAVDLVLAKKAAAAVQKTLADDLLLLAAMDEALDAYRADADETILECNDLLADFPDDSAAVKLGKKLNGLKNLLDKEEAATVLSARAGILAKTFKKAVPLKDALEGEPTGDPCGPPTRLEDVNIGHMTATVGGEPWTSEDVKVMLIVDSDTMEIIQIAMTAEHPDGFGWYLDQLAFQFDTDAFTGPGAYSFNTSTVGPVSMSYVKDPNWFQSLTGTVTVTEFTFDPVGVEPEFVRGRLAGNFSFNGCTVWAGSDTCGALPVTVTSGSFDVCNFQVIYW
jgi:hypothetical protein